MTNRSSEYYQGLLDRVLDLRFAPISEELLADQDNGREVATEHEGDAEKAFIRRPLSPRWKAHQDAVDAALDILVPFARAIVTMEPTEKHGGACLPKDEVEKLLGRVPVRWRGKRK